MFSLSVSCSLNKEVFLPGDIVSAHLFSPHRSLSSTTSTTTTTATTTSSSISTSKGGGSSKATVDPLEALIDIQLLGTLKIDYKWTRTNPAAVAAAVEKPAAGYPLVDAKLASGAVVVYCSSVIRVPLGALVADGGIIFQTQLPLSCMPSFKGISCSVAYNIVLDFSKLGLDSSSKDVAFPVSILSGYEDPSSHILIQSLAFVIPQSDICLDKYLFTSFEEESPVISSNSSFQSIAIQHQHPICMLNMNCINKGSITCYPGSRISSILNFEAVSSRVHQKCLMVKVTLTALEKRPDGSIIQEKILFSSARSAYKASMLNMDIPISESCTPTFTSFIVKNCYRLEFEFQVESASSGNNSNRNSNNSSNSNSNSSNNNSGDGDLETAVMSFDVAISPRPYAYQTNPSPHREARRSMEISSAKNVWTCGVMVSQGQ